eukprot:1754844-Amphidinium_carterae.1
MPSRAPPPHVSRTSLAGVADGTLSMEIKLGLAVTMYWNASHFRGTHFERGLAGSVRYQHRGVSELLLLTAPALEALLGADVSEKARF